MDTTEDDDIPPVLGLLNDVSGIDKSTYTGKVKLDMYRPRNKNPDLYIIKKLHTVMRAWWNIRGAKIKILERDEGGGKISEYKDLPTEHQELDRYVEVIHRYRQSGYHYMTSCHFNLTINKTVGSLKNLNRRKKEPTA